MGFYTNQCFFFFFLGFFFLSRARFGGFFLTQPSLFFLFNLLFYLSLTKDSERDEKRKLRNTKKNKVWICMKKKVKKKKNQKKVKQSRVTPPLFYS